MPSALPTIRHSEKRRQQKQDPLVHVRRQRLRRFRMLRRVPHDPRDGPDHGALRRRRNDGSHRLRRQRVVNAHRYAEADTVRREFVVFVIVAQVDEVLFRCPRHRNCPGRWPAVAGATATAGDIGDARGAVLAGQLMGRGTCEVCVLRKLDRGNN